MNSCLTNRLTTNNDLTIQHLGFDVLVYPLGIRRHFRVNGWPVLETTKVAERNHAFDDPVVFEAHQGAAGV